MTSLAADRLVEGSAASPIRVLVYEDLQCPDCNAFRVMLDTHLLPKYKDKVGFEHRDFPLPKHTWARKAAIAARFFESVKPEAGVEFRRLTLAKLAEIPPSAFDNWVGAFAESKGIDRKKAVESMNDPRFNAMVESDYQEGVARGVAKTPSVFVEGEPFIETFTVDELAKAIDAALQSARK